MTYLLRKKCFLPSTMINNLNKWAIIHTKKTFFCPKLYSKTKLPSSTVLFSLLFYLIQPWPISLFYYFILSYSTIAHFTFLLFNFILFNHNPFYFFTILFYLIQP